MVVFNQIQVVSRGVGWGGTSGTKDLCTKTGLQRITFEKNWCFSPEGFLGLPGGCWGDDPHPSNSFRPTLLGHADHR